MDEKESAYFLSLNPADKIIYVLKSHDVFGGPQSARLLEKMLGMKRKNLDSLLSRLTLKGRIIRLQPGVYKYPGDNRTPKI